MDVKSVAQQLFFTTAHLTCEAAGRTWSGTGFVYGVETDQGTAHFLITNKHVLEHTERITFRMIEGESGRPVLGSLAEATLVGRGRLVWRGHPDPRVDVAALPLAQVVNGLADNGTPAFFRAVGPQLCLNEEKEGELDAIEEVVFIGYPLGIYDAANLLPVARRGITASPISIDYEGMPAFLIDASVFPGSSGSPVFLISLGRRGVLVTAPSPVICLGVLAAVHTREVEGTIEEMEASWGTVIQEPVGLGIVFKSTTFDACIDPFLAEQGLSRADTGVALSSESEPSPADRLLPGGKSER